MICWDNGQGYIISPICQRGVITIFGPSVTIRFLKNIQISLLSHVDSLY